MNVGAAGLFGLLLGVGLILLLELIDHTFKKPEEVERCLELMLLVQSRHLMAANEERKSQG